MAGVREMLDSVLGRSALLGGAHVAGGALGFLTTLVAVRALGDTGYAAVAIGLSLQAYAFVVVAFGTELHAVQQTARDPEVLSRVLARTTLLRLALAVPAALVLAGLALSGVWGRDTSLVLACFSLSVFAQALYPIWAPQALERTGTVAGILLMGQVAGLGLALVAAGLGAPPWGFALAKVGADVAMAAVTLGWVRRRSGAHAVRVTPREVLAEMRTVMPLAGAQMLRSAMISFDVVILSLVVAAAAVGQFAVAFRIYVFVLALASTYFVVVLPIFSRRMKEGHGAVGRELRASLLRTVPPALGGCAVLVWFAEPIMVRLFGPEFAPAAPAFRILMAAVVLNILHRTFRQVLLAAGARATDLGNSAAALAVKLAALLLLARIFGTTGAAIAAALGDLVLLALQWRAARRILRTGDG